MLVSTPEIVWHNKEPVFSVDFHLSGEICRLASSGADHTVKIWRVDRAEKNVKIIFLANLERHVKAVNVVRFSPDGQYLASGSDDCTICLWQLKKDDENICSIEMDDGISNKENWTIYKMLRGHIEDIYDLCWSHDSLNLISGSVDNTAIVWNITNGEKLTILKESRHYIQGVAWDQYSNCLATLGTDRALRIYHSTKSHKDKFKCVHSISKLVDDNTKSTRMFLDETISSFFRRLAFSPDGNILITPGGCLDSGDKCINVTWIFTKSSLPKPVLYLPTPDKPSVVVKFCPILFELKTSTSQSMIQLPYRMIFAVLTIDKVLLYDTQQLAPIGYISDIHYASLTDATWSNDGRLLIVSSTDGYCTVVSFDYNELGVPFSNEVNTPISSTPQTPPISSMPQAPPTSQTPPILSCDNDIPPQTPPTPTIGHTSSTPRRIIPVKLDEPNSKQPRRVNFITIR